MDTGLLIMAVLTAAITAGTPILYAALGEILAERTGVMNLGLEGMMLVGAVSGFLATAVSGNHWVGLLVAILAGGAVGAVHATLCIVFKADQVVSGLALTIFGIGLSGFLGSSLVGIPAPSTFQKIPIPLLRDIPVLGRILFQHDPLVYATYLLVPLLWIFLYRTNAGLKMRSVGENPAAADALGIHVVATRYLYVILGGCFSGVAGAYLSLAYTPTWIEHMTAGRGWIAIALVIFSTWNPARALLGAYIFGGAGALAYRVQLFGGGVSPYFLNMLPYLITIAVLIFATLQTHRNRIGAPGALMVPYDREDR